MMPTSRSRMGDHAIGKLEEEGVGCTIPGRRSSSQRNFASRGSKSTRPASARRANHPPEAEFGGRSSSSSAAPPRMESSHLVDTASPLAPLAADRQPTSLEHDLVDVCGLRETYEQIWAESRQRRVALDWLLRARDSTPGIHSLHLSEKSRTESTMLPQTLASEEASDLECQSRNEPPKEASPPLRLKDKDINRWVDCQYCPSRISDLAKLECALQSFAQMQGTASVLLQDVEASSILWRISAARRRMATEPPPCVLLAAFGVLGNDAPRFMPRKVLLESPWLQFETLCKAAFRIFPAGDGSAERNTSTIYIWMSRPPGLSFTFSLRLGDMHLPARLWQATTTRMRFDISWFQLDEALRSQATDGDAMEFSIRVLQWHGPEDDPEEWAPEKSASASLALEVLQDLGAGAGWQRRERAERVEFVRRSK